MSSTYSASLRLNYQAAGDNLNTWGLRLNSGVFQLLEDAITGRASVIVSGPVTLLSSLGATDVARMSWLALTGTGGTVTIPSVVKTYLVFNGCTAAVTFTTGGTTNAVIPAGARARIGTDGSSVWIASSSEFGGAKLTGVGYPSADTDAATKKYVVDTAFTANSGIFPGQPGNAHRFLGTDGTTAVWSDPLPDQTGQAHKVLRTSGTALTGAFWDFGALTGASVVTAASYTVQDADGTGLLILTGSAAAVQLPQLAAYSGRFSVIVRNDTTGTATVSAYSGETVVGSASCPMPPNEARLFIGGGGTDWKSLILRPYSLEITSTQTLAVGPGYARHVGLLWSAGAGGSFNAGGGVGGGGGGGCIPFDLSSTSFGTSQVITIGAGGAGATSTAGNGANGGNSSIGSLVTVYGGNGSSVPFGGSAFGVNPATNNAGGGAFQGGSPASDTTKGASYGGGAGASAAGFGGGFSVYGGGGGGTDSGGSSQGAGASIFGGNGGGPGLSTASGADGAAPGGGGGGSNAGAGFHGGAGARGACRIRGVI